MRTVLFLYCRIITFNKSLAYISFAGSINLLRHTVEKSISKNLLFRSIKQKEGNDKVTCFLLARH